MTQSQSTSETRPAQRLFEPSILKGAFKDAFVKLDPRQLIRNPVMFVTEIVAMVVTILAVRDLITGNSAVFSG